MTLSWDYLVTALVVIVVPGTGVVYTVTAGMTLGRRESVAAALGCTLGIVPAIAAAVAGLAALLHASALIFQFVKYCGVAYLLYLAWQTLQQQGPLPIGAARGTPHSYLAIVRTGALINVLNPKLSVFFLAFLPQFIDPAAGPAVVQMLELGGLFMAMTFAVFVVYGFFAAKIGERLLRSAFALKWMRRSVAAVFAGFGVRLALAER